jgi:uncharacterized protein (DUF1501 family)
MNKDASIMISRRNFLKASVALGMVAGTGELLLPRRAYAAGFAAVNNPILVNISLDGGPDMRYLFPPAWNSASGSYGRRHWDVRAHVHDTDGSASALQACWQNDYAPAYFGNTQFGILKQCGFLKQLWDAGQLALVNNAYTVNTRDHQHGQLVMEQGNSTAGKTSEGSGWGGRLAQAVGGHVLALSNSARTFTFGPDPTAPNDLTRVNKSRLVHLRNMREASLYQPQPNEWPGPAQMVAHSLKAYYASKRPQVAADSSYFPFMEHERKLRELGSQIDTRLAGIPKPAALDALLKAASSSNQSYLIQQVLNLHDALACQDILDMRVASLEHQGSWDTHNNQKTKFEDMAEPLFGANGALAMLYQALPAGVWSKLVFVLSGEFGRQLVENGGNGTDHGVGTSMLVFGGGVRGGLYGDMFPEEELTRLNDPGADILGRTAIEHVFGAACEWVAPGSKATIFPTAAGAPIESGVALQNLFV